MTKECFDGTPGNLSSWGYETIVGDDGALYLRLFIDDRERLLTAEAVSGMAKDLVAVSAEQLQVAEAEAIRERWRNEAWPTVRPTLKRAV